jgi:hypothetical protein
METLIVLTAVNVLSNTVNAMIIRRREEIIQKWKEGLLSEVQLKWLRRQVWFRKRYMKKIKESVSLEKKQN